MKLVTVIPVGSGRLENLEMALRGLRLQSRAPDGLVVVEDGPGIDADTLGGCWPRCPALVLWGRDKHEPGMEQPRNAGVRAALEKWPDTTHVHFLDSDVVLTRHALASLEGALTVGNQARIVVAPYEWAPAGVRPDPADEASMLAAAGIQNDPRWEMFRASPPERVYEGDLSAGLACFSGNLLWPVNEFLRVGGFWAELHHGRCEDGELGLRAVAMGVPISFQSAARGYHLWHPVNVDLALERNRRDVPMLNERHPWVERGAVFMVDRDGKAFDVRCPSCGWSIHTNQWWAHAADCQGDLALPVGGGGLV